MDIAAMVKVLEGHATKAEMDAFSHWMAVSEVHRHEFRQVRQLWQLTQKPWPAPLDERPLMQIHQRMRTRYRRKVYTKTLSVAASAILISVITWGLWPSAGTQRRNGERMAFHHASLKEVAIHLEKKFDVHIQIIGTGLETCLFTGSFSKTSTLTDVMHAISLSLRVSIKDTRTGYEWKGPGC